ncbi:YoaK family protein [Vagococcus carniphilus]|uniref:YoaK family protein n=1 Tax=Vagococcus carniphilus TaxID=218144 RepID=UPI00288F5392|nr:YoaK family protein [Vagococcus carniphilus]MDT2848259.1 YoaK family protein [Vagococcus carniphilus]
MQNKLHEDKLVGLVLTFIGGALDAYTYIHYEVFASAQTGNVIQGIIQLFEGQWGSVGKKFLSTVFFLLGVILAKFLIDYFYRKKIHYWRLFVLYYEALLFFVISINLINKHQAAVTMLIAFTASVQWVVFDKIEGRQYTSLFTTGNLKGMGVNLYEYLKTKEEKDKQNFFHFFWVVVAFLSGAIVSTIFYKWLGGKAILMVSLLFLVLSIYETILMIRFYKENNLMN